MLFHLHEIYRLQGLYHPPHHNRSESRQISVASKWNLPGGRARVQIFIEYYGMLRLLSWFSNVSMPGYHTQKLNTGTPSPVYPGLAQEVTC